MPEVFLIFILGRGDPVLRFPPNTNDAEIVSTRGYHTNLIGKNCFLQILAHPLHRFKSISLTC